MTFEWISNILKRSTKKPIYFVDGDSCIKDTWVYLDVLGSSEVYILHNADSGNNKPKMLRDLPEVNYIPFSEFRASKESADKLIGILSQKAISSGYTDINLVSKDCDFPDIAKMVAGVNSDCKHKVTVRVLLPEVKERAKGVDYRNSVHGNVTVMVYWIKRTTKRKEVYE